MGHRNTMIQILTYIQNLACNHNVDIMTFSTFMKDNLELFNYLVGKVTQLSDVDKGLVHDYCVGIKAELQEYLKQN